MKKTYLSLLVLAGTLLVARGEQFRTDINPALIYYQAFLVAQPISEADSAYLASKKGIEQKLPERFSSIIAGYDNQSRIIQRAAHATAPCEWGLDLTLGPNDVFLPYLARARAFSQVAELRARWDLEHGRQAEARNELAAAFVLARNSANDGLLISSLVQCKMEDVLCAAVARHFGEFEPETLMQLDQAIKSAPAHHSIAATMPSEKGLLNWLMRTITGLQKAYPNDDAKVMASFQNSGYFSVMEAMGETNLWSRVAKASGGTSGGAIKLIEEAEPVLGRIATVMAVPASDYNAQAKQLETEISQSPNPFINTLGFYFHGWNKQVCRTREFRALAELAMVHAAVEYRLHGEAGLSGVMDPFGKGPFAFRRFVLKRVDRGFELKSAYAGADGPFAMIFVEKSGAAFEVAGPDAGKPITR